jgi:hypothetical protein
VPLFLGPLYADRRIHDMRILRAHESKATAPEDTKPNGPASTHTGGGRAPVFAGQVNFCSGWEWGYWLGDVLTARAAWQGERHSDYTKVREPALPSAAH